MTEQLKNKIRDIVTNSGISQDYLDLWSLFLEKNDKHEILAPIADALEAGSEAVVSLSVYLKYEMEGAKTGMYPSKREREFLLQSITIQN